MLDIVFRFDRLTPLGTVPGLGNAPCGLFETASDDDVVLRHDDLRSSLTSAPFRWHEL